MAGLSLLEVRCVKPFYLKMMGCNALNYPVQYRRLHDLGRGVTDDDVVRLLRGLWRPRVMGAWFAAGREERVATELLRSLETSAGSLTAPPLATVALRGIGTAAVPALQAYLAVDLEWQHGSASFIAAALDRLGSPPEHPPPKTRPATRSARCSRSRTGSRSVRTRTTRDEPLVRSQEASTTRPWGAPVQSQSPIVMLCVFHEHRQPRHERADPLRASP